MTILIILQIVILILTLIELFSLRKNRIVFEELIIKFVEAVQISFNNTEAHIKKISDNASILSKSSNNSLSIKDSIKHLESITQEFQTTSKIIKSSAQKEFKLIEEGIKKIKLQLLK